MVDFSNFLRKEGACKHTYVFVWNANDYIIPKGFFTKSNILTAKRTQILERKFAFRRMLEEIRHSHGKLNDINEIDKSKLEFVGYFESLKS